MRRLAAAIAAVLLLAGPTPAAAPDGPPGQGGLRARALELVNESRRSRGLPPLQRSSALDSAADAHARDMLRRGYYDHVSPEGETVMDRYVRAGGSRWRLVAENIAKCERCGPPADLADVARLHEGWMRSPSHRENILAAGVSGFGFAIVAEAGRGLYAVQTFAGPGTAGGAAGRSAPAAPGAIGADRQRALMLDAINAERRRHDVSGLAGSDRLDALATTLLAAGALDRLSAEQRRGWRSLAMLSGSCGGCGARPEAADIGFFARQWTGDAPSRDSLLDPAWTHLGFALAADGEGRKSAAVTLGRR